MSSAELTSPASARAWAPVAVISSAIVRTRSAFRPVNATIRPPFAKRRATAAPSPAEAPTPTIHARSEEHTSELQSLTNLVCRLLLEKKKAGVHGRQHIC